MNTLVLYLRFGDEFGEQLARGTGVDRFLREFRGGERCVGAARSPDGGGGVGNDDVTSRACFAGQHIANEGRTFAGR